MSTRPSMTTTFDDVIFTAFEPLDLFLKGSDTDTELKGFEVAIVAQALVARAERHIRRHIDRMERATGKIYFERK